MPEVKITIITTMDIVPEDFEETSMEDAIKKMQEYLFDGTLDLTDVLEGKLEDVLVEEVQKHGFKK